MFTHVWRNGHYIILDEQRKKRISKRDGKERNFLAMWKESLIFILGQAD